MNTNNIEKEDTVYGFTLKELESIREDYKTNLNPERTFHKLSERLFRNEKIRSLTTLNPQANEDDRKKAERIKTAFYNLQMCVVQKSVSKKERIVHKKGEFKHNEDGSPILKANGNNEEYTRDEIEYKEKMVEVPAWDLATNPNGYPFLKKFIEEDVVAPDFEYLIRKTCAHTDFKRGCEIIRELTNYYIFEDPQKFVDRFSLFICNAKSRVLNIQPEWPVMFSLVGEMGTGKGWLSKMLIQTHDELFETKSSQAKYRTLLGRFNGVMLTRGLIHLDEKNGLANEDRETLKTNISEGTIEIELKGKDPFTTSNMATLFSTTNESIKDIIGLQKDRRIVEFNLIDRAVDENGNRKKIDEEYMKQLLHELWMVMPCEHPYSTSIKDALLSESSEILDCNMYEIAGDVFTFHLHEFTTDKWVKRNKLKQVIKSIGSVRHNDFVNWCQEKGLLNSYGNGTTYYSQQVLDEILEQNRRKSEIDPCQSTRESQVQSKEDSIWNI